MTIVYPGHTTTKANADLDLLRAGTSPLRVGEIGVVDVRYPYGHIKRHGAKQDGVTDDGPAINSAISSIRAVWGQTGGDVSFDPGPCLINTQVIFNSWLHVRFIGLGTQATKISGSQAFSCGFVDAGGSTTFENLDMTAIAGYAITVFGTFHHGPLFVRRCRYNANGISLFGVGHAMIEDNLFDGQGKFLYTAVKCSASCHNVTVRRNRLRYMSQGLIVDNGGGGLSRNIRFTENYCDGGWYSFAADLSGTFTGSTATTLVDSTAHFLSAGIQTNTYVRSMPVAFGSNGGSFGRTEIADNSIDFTTQSIKRGDIVRCDTLGVMAIVAAVPTTAHTLEIEEWLSDVDRTDAVIPAAGSHYYLLHSVMGRISSVASDTTLNVTRWFLLDGSTISSPGAGVSYEICKTLANYQVLLDSSVEQSVVERNTIVRPMSDGVGCGAKRSRIVNNHFVYCQDEGITLEVGASDNLVAQNIIEHTGTCGIIVLSDSNIVSENVVEDAHTYEGTTSIESAGILLLNANKNVVANNRVKKLNSPQHLHGIVVEATSGTSDKNILTGNNCNDVPNDHIALSGAGVTNTQCANNSAAAVLVNGATSVQDFVPAPQVQIDTTSGATLAALETNVNKVVALLQATALAKV